MKDQCFETSHKNVLKCCLKEKGERMRRRRRQSVPQILLCAENFVLSIKQKSFPPKIVFPSKPWNLATGVCFVLLRRIRKWKQTLNLRIFVPSWKLAVDQAAETSGFQAGITELLRVRNKIFGGLKCDFRGWEFVCFWV